MIFTAENKTQRLVILLAVLSVVGVICAATFGYLYFNEKSKYEHLKSTNELEEVKDDSSKDSNDQDDNDPEVDNDAQTEEPKVMTKDFECSQWAYADTGTKVPHMYIVYEESENVSFENENKKCENIVMKYKNAKLYLTYSYGESYASSLTKKGTEVVIVKTAKKDLGGQMRTLTVGRQKYTHTEAASANYPAGYWLNYVFLQSKAECEVEDQMSGEILGYPCYVGANPFVTPAGRFDLFFPTGTSEADIIEGVEYFDDVAKNSYYKEI